MRAYVGVEHGDYEMAFLERFVLWVAGFTGACC